MKRMLMKAAGILAFVAGIVCGIMWRGEQATKPTPELEKATITKPTDIVFHPGCTADGAELAGGVLRVVEGVLEFEGSLTNCAPVLAATYQMCAPDDPARCGTVTVHFYQSHSVTRTKDGLVFEGRWHETAMRLVEMAYKRVQD